MNSTQVEFEKSGTAVEIIRSGRSPLVLTLHKALLALGVVIASYQLRPSETEIVERFAFETKEGQPLEAPARSAVEAVVRGAVAQAEPGLQARG